MTEPTPPLPDATPPATLRRPRFLHPPVQEAPPPRGEVMRAAIISALLIALLSYAAYTMVDWDFEGGTVKRQLDDATRDLASAARSVDEYARRRGRALEPAEGDALAEELAIFYAELQGGSALALERGRQVRGDVFAPGRGRTAPLRHVAIDGDWALASRGPDRDWDIEPEALRSDLATGAIAATSCLHAYDPTNGALSSGDLWVTSNAGASFAERKEPR